MPSIYGKYWNTLPAQPIKSFSWDQGAVFPGIMSAPITRPEGFPTLEASSQIGGKVGILFEKNTILASRIGCLKKSFWLSVLPERDLLKGFFFGKEDVGSLFNQIKKSMVLQKIKKNNFFNKVFNPLTTHNIFKSHIFEKAFSNTRIFSYIKDAAHKFLSNAFKQDRTILTYISRKSADLLKRQFRNILAQPTINRSTWKEFNRMVSKTLSDKWLIRKIFSRGTFSKQLQSIFSRTLLNSTARFAYNQVNHQDRSKHTQDFRETAAYYRSQQAQTLIGHMKKAVNDNRQEHRSINTINTIANHFRTSSQSQLEMLNTIARQLTDLNRKIDLLHTGQSRIQSRIETSPPSKDGGFYDY